MLHFPLVLINRLNKTESAVFLYCRLSLFLKDPFFPDIYLVHANNKGADQTVQPHILISDIVIHSLESIIAKLATCKMSLSGLSL